jgi:hypothetical protein
VSEFRIQDQEFCGLVECLFLWSLGQAPYGTRTPLCVCVFITAGPSTKLFAWGGGDMGGHVLRETTSPLVTVRGI